MSKYDGTKDWYLGLDVGTNSVGWAATDTEYNVLKFNGNATWGIYLFDEAKTSESRRINRTARRRLARKKQRIALLQGFFAHEISKVDENFFLRIKESSLWSEDRTLTGDVRLFVGDELNDKQYNEKYPTIHHLICDLIDNEDYHDPRLVYMACSYILSHRGHFLLDVDETNIDAVVDFSGIYNDFLSWFDSNDIDLPWNCSSEVFANELKKKTGTSVKEKSLIQLLFNGSKPKDKDDDIVSVKTLLSFICGRKVKLSDLFKKEEYKELEVASFAISSSKFDEEIESLSSAIDDNEFDLILKIKKMYDWSVLVDILKGEKYISKAKIETYEQHERDLKFLKHVIKVYAPEKYDEVFREIGDKPNYASYSYNSKNCKGELLPKEYKKCSAEEFCKYIKNIVVGLDSIIESDDIELYTDMIERLSNGTFCPKQMTGDNRVIPYQLYYVELREILENASRYLSFLNEADSYGTVKEKILSMMKFRIPYYVGPLNPKSEFAWIARKADGEILPWNFEEKVDLDKSEEAFIRRMTAKCTYLAGEDVLPKNSLLYAKFCVLNEINNISINDNKIPVTIKQEIYENLFMKYRKVSYKKICDYLRSAGLMKADDELRGIDKSIKSELKAYHDFKEYITKGILSEHNVEDIITRITLTTDRNRLKNWLRTEYNLNEDDVKKISKFKYSDFGRLSERVLTQVFDVDVSTGEQRRPESIIQMMWETNLNFMMLMSSDFGYAGSIESINRDYYSDKALTLDDRLKEMYISNSVKRPILRTVEIVKELKSIFKCEPKKVFIEMARGASEDQKGKRTKSRKDQIRELYSNYPDNEVAELLKELNCKTDDELRSEKLFLYFTQLGKCMYSGETINIEDIGNSKLYDVDHIWPQSKIKDDSIDNKVLVSTIYNGKKGDDYPLPEEWRNKRYAFWKSLREKNLISEKKFDRLKRVSRFTDEELAQFINRQLVETRQSTKALATILGEYLENTKIVYVKAGIVSDFRQEFKGEPYYTLKCREVNDLHHAKDAYLNIVMGNIYNVKYTGNPLAFIKSGERYSLKMRTLLNHDVKRGEEVAWLAADDEWFDRIIKQLHKNNIRFVRYSYYQTGELFDVKPVRKTLGQVPRKNNLNDIDKYGGYNKPTITGFYLISYDGKKAREKTLVPVPLHIAETIKTNEDKIKYCINSGNSGNSGYANPTLLLNGRMIKINTLLEIDGYRVHLSGKSGNYIWMKGAQQLILSPEWEGYVKRMVKYCDRALNVKETLLISEYDDLSVERNNALYDILSNKLVNAKYSTLMKNATQTVVKGKKIFEELSIEKQTIALMKVLSLFDCNNTQGKDLSLIGGKKSSGIQYIPLKLDKKDHLSITIIDVSPTGLFENKTVNLLDL